MPTAIWAAANMLPMRADCNHRATLACNGTYTMAPEASRALTSMEFYLMGV